MLLKKLLFKQQRIYYLKVATSQEAQYRAEKVQNFLGSLKIFFKHYQTRGAFRQQDNFDRFLGDETPQNIVAGYQNKHIASKTKGFKYGHASYLTHQSALSSEVRQVAGSFQERLKSSACVFAIRVLGNYNKKWGLSSVRKARINHLSGIFANNKTSYKDLYIALVDARKVVITEDREHDQSWWKRRRNRGSSRFMANMDLIRSRLISSCSGSDLDELLICELIDIKNTLEDFPTKN